MKLALLLLHLKEIKRRLPCNESPEQKRFKGNGNVISCWMSVFITTVSRLTTDNVNNNKQPLLESKPARLMLYRVTRGREQNFQ